MFKVNNTDTETTSLTSGVFIVKFEHILHLVRVPIANFEHLIAGWENTSSTCSIFIDLTFLKYKKY